MQGFDFHSQALVFFSRPSPRSRIRNLQKLLLLFFEHFYHEFARTTYDFLATAVSIGRWKAWQRVALVLAIQPSNNLEGYTDP